VTTHNEWPDLFIVRAGYKPEAILKVEFAFPLPAVANNLVWCKLCDAHVPAGTREEHVKDHKRELVSWRKRREAEAKQRSAEALRAHNQARRENKLLRERRGA